MSQPVPPNGDPSPCIVQRWFQPQDLVGLLFCLGWNFFLVRFYAHILQRPHSLASLLLPLGHVVIGLCLSYATLARLINRTVITLKDGELQIRTGPLPWPR